MKNSVYHKPIPTMRRKKIYNIIAFHNENKRVSVFGFIKISPPKSRYTSKPIFVKKTRNISRCN